MARFNTQSITTSVTGAGTVASPQAFTALNGTAPYTVTLPSPVLFPGSSQTFYNATAGTVTISTPSGLFGGLGASGAGTLAIPTNTVVSVTSDGVNYIVLSEDGSALVATTGSFSSNVTANGASATVSLTPQTVTIAPTGASTIDNINIGASTRGSGAFNTLTANSAVTLTANTTSSSTGSGTLVVTGGVGVSGAVYAAGLYGPLTGTVQTAAQTNITSVGTLTALTVNALTVNGVASLNGRTTVRDTINADTSYPLGIQNGSQQPWFLRALTTSNKFSIHLNGTGDLVTVDTAGTVIIGATANHTGAKLFVDNSIHTNYNGEIAMRYNVSGQDTAYWKGMTGTMPSAGGTARGLHFFNYDADSDQGIGFWTGRPGSATSLVRIYPDGKVGIGPSSPLGKLHISTTDMFAAYKTYSGLGNTGAGDAVFDAYRLDGALQYKRVLDIVALGDSTNNRESETRFFTTNLSGSTAERLRITGAGNVGIGVTSPAYKLHVAGTSGTDDPRLTAINSTIAATAVDVFVYDTRKDSDGGAWRKRTQHTSWYNETLNSATRGARREFPAVAVIVANSTTNGIIIYDGDSPDMPMWITYSYLSWDGPMRGISAMNGIIAGVIFGAINYSGNGLVLLDFIKDRQSRNYVSGYSNLKNGFVYELLSTTRVNTTYLTTGTDTREYTLGNYNTTDVAMTVLPGAPVDPYTRLPTPTIAVGTLGGTSIVQNDGRVTNITCNNGGYTTTKKVTFLADNALGISLEAGDPNAEDSFYIFNQVPQYSTVVTVDARAGTPIAPDAFYSSQLVNTANVNLFVNGLDTARKINKVDRLVFGTDYGITQIDENRSNPSYGMTNFISSKYNTGWMVGNIRGAWLSDTTAETVTGAELITNGTFTSNTTGWTANTANGTGHTFSAVGGVMSVVRAAGKGTGFGEPYQVLTVEINKQYVVAVDVGTTPMSLSIASALTSGTIYYNANLPVGRSVILFTPTVTTVYFLFICDNAGTTSTVDNVSVIKAELDRSTNNKGLQIFGSIVKTPVATGADLVAYSGWSGSNYLFKPIDSTITGSTTRFFAGWMKCSNTSQYQYLMSIGNRSGGAAWGVSLNVTSGNIYVYDNVNQSSFSTSPSVADGLWHFVCVSDTGKYKQIYLDGKLIHTVTTATYTVPSDSSYYAGVYSGAQDLGYYPFLGSLALQRFSITIPSQTQIDKMYNDEKELFQTGAKACLYGASDVITAITNDTTTNLVHVGTSSGRSVFQGIRRVDNTATAVSAAISASNSMIAEQ